MSELMICNRVDICDSIHEGTLKCCKTPHEKSPVCDCDLCDFHPNSTCIPYIPEYECTARERICPIETVGEYRCKGCLHWQPKKLCPECGHKAHLGSCYFLEYVNGKPTECGCYIPADLKPAEPQAEMPLIDNPENPYPEDIFPMQIWDYAEAIPDEEQRTAISGCVGRYVWNVCCEDWQGLISEWLPAHDQQVAAKAVKEFAGQVCNYLKEEVSFNSPALKVLVIAHIKAMAEQPAETVEG